MGGEKKSETRFCLLWQTPSQLQFFLITLLQLNFFLQDQCYILYEWKPEKNYVCRIMTQPVIVSLDVWRLIRTNLWPCYILDYPCITEEM